MYPQVSVTAYLACARLSDSIGDVLKRAIENKTRATWERGRYRPCLSQASARLSHFFLLNDYSPPSWNLEQATAYSEAKIDNILIAAFN